MSSRNAPAWIHLPRSYRVVSVLLTACLVCPSIARSQTTAEGSIRGIVRDEQGAVLPGATVTAVSITAPAPAAAVTDGTGLYRLLTLVPGTYKVTAKLQGFSEVVREQVVVRAGLNVGLDLVMAVGNMNETVNITADTPLLESRRAVTSMNVSGEFQRALPLSARQQFHDFLLLTPGTVHTEDVMTSDYYVNGSASNVFQLDGADIDAPSTSRTVYLFGSSSIVQDVQVSTSGMEASAPLGQGASINIVTRSGTNQYQGTGAFVFQPKAWTGNNNPGGTTSAYSLTQPDIALGGPFSRDRAWFFADYRYTRINQSISRTPTQLANLQALDPGFQPFGNETTNHQFFLKPTIKLSDRHRLQMFDQYGVDSEWVSDAVSTAPFFKQDLGGHAASIRLDSVWQSNLTTRAAIGFSNQSNPNYMRYDDRPSRVVYQSAEASEGALFGDGLVGVLDNYQYAPVYTAPGQKLTLTFDANYHKSGRWGTHDLQAGVLVQPLRTYKINLQFPNHGFVLEEDVLKDPTNLSGGFVPFHRAVYDNTSVTYASTNSQDFGGYLQDEWRPTQRLTITGGVRIDKIQRRDRLFNATLQDTTGVGPRFGFNFALTDDRRNMLRGTAGIVHDSTADGTLITAGSNFGGDTDSYDLDLDGVFETSFYTPGVTQRTLNRVVDLANYRLPHAVDFTVGYARQLPGRVTLDVSVLRREFKDRPATYDINGIYNGNVFVGYANPDFNAINRLTSNTYNWPVYTGVTLQAAREGTRWQFLADYTRQFRHMAGTWLPHDPASFIQPNAFADDKSIGIITGSVSNSLSGTAMTQAVQWRDHVFRAAVNVNGPWGVLLASTLTVQSGLWSGPIVTKIAAPDPQFGPATVVLSNGRVVQNPLATTIRLAYPTLGDGQLKSPVVTGWNIRAGRRITIGHVRLDPTIEVLNLLNRGADYLWGFGANQLYNPLYAQGSGSLQPPRSVQGTIRVDF